MFYYHDTYLLKQRCIKIKTFKIEQHPTLTNETETWDGQQWGGGGGGGGYTSFMACKCHLPPQLTEFIWLFGSHGCLLAHQQQLKSMKKNRDGGGMGGLNRFYGMPTIILTFLRGLQNLIGCSARMDIFYLSGNNSDQ